jgi:hypothetical protein
MAQRPPAPPPPGTGYLHKLLPADELFVLCTWAVQAVAADLGIDEDDAMALMASAQGEARVQILGNAYFAGVQVDGRWVVCEGRARLTLATREWQTLRAMERQLTE